MAAQNPALNDTTFDKAVAASAASPRGMSVVGTYLLTFGLLILLVVGAAFGWDQVDVITTASGQQIATTPSWVWLAVFVVFILAMFTIFSPGTAPITAPLYALIEGAVLGVVSKYYELDYDGIVAQAVVATVAIFLAMLILYMTRIFKVTRGYVLGLVAAMFALSLLWFTAWMLSIFGVDFRFWNDPSPWGIAISGGIVLLGALNLPVDFNFIEKASDQGAPRIMMWYGAFGLLLSLIWIYISVLRFLAIARRV